MENKPSLLKLKTIEITPDIVMRIPTVGEILNNEQNYYNLTSTLTASPFSYMVQLDDIGVDYTTIDEWELFVMLFSGYSSRIKDYQNIISQLVEEKNNCPPDSGSVKEIDFKINSFNTKIVNFGFNMLFENLDASGFEVMEVVDTDQKVLYNKSTDTIIDYKVYIEITDTLRNINLYEKNKFKPGNDKAKEYLIKKERKKQKRNAKKPYGNYLEKMVIALVNTSEFPYNYETCMDLSIYQFNQSLKQIKHKIDFDNTILGVYFGTVDTSKLTNKDCLNWMSV